MDAPRILASRRALIGFFLKMGAAYAVWFVLYDLWLLPDGRLDTWLSHVVAARTADVLAPFFDGVRVSGRVVRLGASPGIIVEDGCNGLSPLSLFVGFVLAYPGTARRRLLFIPAGLLVVSAVNVLRCAALLVVQAERPGWFEPAHRYEGLFLFYVVIFALWVAWAHLGGATATPAATPPATPAVGPATPAEAAVPLRGAAA